MSNALASTEAPADAELISAVRGGDVDAYGDLFARHVEAARRLARQIAPASDVDDLVSDAFAKVLSVLQRGGGPDVAFRAYLLTSVRRLHVDRIRVNQRVHSTDDLEKFDPGVPFEDTAVAGFENEAAAKAFASLPERWQLVLWHTEVEGQKPAEVGLLLGMSANSVSALAYRAREGLREAFLNAHAQELDGDTCRWVHEHLGAYVRGGTSRRDSAKVEQHLDECRKCMAVYLELTEVNSNLAGIIAPLLLGVSGAAYVAASSAATKGGLVLLSLKLRDTVQSNGPASAGVGVAAAAAVIAGLLVLTPSGDPEVPVAANDGAAQAPNGGAGGGAGAGGGGAGGGPGGGGGAGAGGAGAGGAGAGGAGGAGAGGGGAGLGAGGAGAGGAGAAAVATPATSTLAAGTTPADLTAPGGTAPVATTPGGGEPGDGDPGDGEPGDGDPGDGDPGDGEPGDGEPGDGEPGDGEPGDGEPGDGEPGDGEPGDGEPGDGDTTAEVGVTGPDADGTFQLAVTVTGPETDIPPRLLLILQNLDLLPAVGQVGARQAPTPPPPAGDAPCEVAASNDVLGLSAWICTTVRDAEDSPWYAKLGVQHRGGELPGYAALVSLAPEVVEIDDLLEDLWDEADKIEFIFEPKEEEPPGEPEAPVLPGEPGDDEGDGDGEISPPVVDRGEATPPGEDTAAQAAPDAVNPDSADPDSADPGSADPGNAAASGVSTDGPADDGAAGEDAEQSGFGLEAAVPAPEAPVALISADRTDQADSGVPTAPEPPAPAPADAADRTTGERTAPEAAADEAVR